MFSNNRGMNEEEYRKAMEEMSDQISLRIVNLLENRLGYQYNLEEANRVLSWYQYLKENTVHRVQQSPWPEWTPLISQTVPYNPVTLGSMIASGWWPQPDTLPSGMISASSGEDLSEILRNRDKSRSRGKKPVNKMQPVRLYTPANSVAGFYRVTEDNQSDFWQIVYAVSQNYVPEIRINWYATDNQSQEE